MAQRDMTAAQFRAALERHGIRPSYGAGNVLSETFGYVTMPDGTNVSRHNGGRTYRAQLAYLLKQAEIFTVIGDALRP